jgi:hypothetical protein
MDKLVIMINSSISATYKGLGLLFLFSVIVLLPIKADDGDKIQEEIDAKLAKIDNRSRFEIYSTYMTKISYAGRYYGASGVAIYPTIAYKHKSGFQAEVANYFWTGNSPVLTQTVFDVGYSKTLTSWLGGGISYARTFLYYGTDSDKRAMNNAINLSLGFYLPWVNIGAEYGYMFGYDQASGLHLAASRDFPFYKFLGSDIFTLTPSVGTFFGSQASLYYYFSKNQVKKINKGNGNAKSNGKGKESTTTATTTTALEPTTVSDTKFQLLAYQLSLAATYRISHFSFELGFKYDIPTNLPTDYTYGSSPLAYFAGSVRYTF